MAALYRDQRFYELALFAFRDIKKGEELCYHYGYVPDSVKGVRVMCRCGADECQGRFL